MTSQELVEEIFRTRIVQDANGKEYPLDSNVEANEGAFLQGLIQQYQPQKTIEIGCAFGISSLYICAALEKNGGAKTTP